MIKEDSIIWYNGQLLQEKDCRISILTHSLHYGSSVFEGIRAYEDINGNSKIFRLEEHIDRLFYSAKCLFMEIDFTKEEVMNACKKVLEENKLKSAYLRPIIFYGNESMGLNPSNNKAHIAIIAWEWGKYLKDGVKVKISSIKRISEHSLTVDAKVGGHYVNSIYATTEAKNLGYDEGLLLDHDGNIAEGPGENIFFVKDKMLFTPKLGKILKGITRDAIIEIAKDLDYTIIERNITPFEINSFDGAFFVGTAAEVTAIKEISGIMYDLNCGKDIKDKFFEVVAGKDEKYKNWLY